MPILEIQSAIDAELSLVASEALCMTGVNRELFPLVRMTSPLAWRDKPLKDWPRNRQVFSSAILLFGFLPVDLHRFKLESVWDNGFEERSESVLNSEWEHRRTIDRQGMCSVVCDRVVFRSRVRILGKILLPVYRAIFRHRHRRLRARYGACR